MNEVKGIAPDECNEVGDFTVVVLPRLHVYALPFKLVLYR